MTFQIYSQFIKEKGLADGSWLLLGNDSQSKIEEVIKLSLQFSLPSDILIISPEENISSEYSEKILTLDLSVSSIRRAINFLQLSPLGEKKILIISNGEELNAESQNTLLKTIEEPLKNRVIFFLAKEESQIFSTLSSRMKKIKFDFDFGKYFKNRITQEEIDFFNSPKENGFWADILKVSDEKKIEFVENLSFLIRKDLLALKNTDNDLEKIYSILKYLPRLRNKSINHRLQLESLLFKIFY